MTDNYNKRIREFIKKLKTIINVENCSIIECIAFDRVYNWNNKKSILSVLNDFGTRDEDNIDEFQNIIYCLIKLMAIKKNKTSMRFMKHIIEEICLTMIQDDEWVLEDIKLCFATVKKNG